MARIDHQGHGQRLQGVERAKEHVHCHKLYGAGKDGQAHEHGIPKGKAGHVHIDSISQAEKPKSCENRDSIWERCPKSVSAFCVLQDYPPFFAKIAENRQVLI